MAGQQIQKIQSFFQNLTTQFSPPQVTEPDEALANVPSGVLNELRQKMGQMPVLQPHTIAVREACTEALKAWRADPEIENNSLVVLSQPMEAIAPILKASFQEDFQNCDIQFCLSGYQRPNDPLTITDHLRRELEPEETPANEAPSAPATEKDIEETKTTVVVVPNLEQCFLRCIQGWEGIEYLQSLVAHDTARFWIFGCNFWAWAFLDKVCLTSAYFEQTLVLPELTGDDLRTWLAKLIDTPLETAIPECSELRVEAHDEDDYWNYLADSAKGFRPTAVHLWLRSLRMPATDVTAEGTLASDADKIRLIPTKPEQPELMTLEVIDRYLLHALLIHSEMTRSHLALSLGESERTIRPRVQVLQREGIILQRGRRLSIHPAHYPKLYSELQNNNFLTGQS
jgi:hypothetical protein